LPAKKKEAEAPAKVAPELQEYVDARGFPAVFLFLAEALDLQHVFQIRSCLSDSHFDELDLVVNSYGGSIHAAYQIVEVLRLHADRLNVCVPLLAKSAATLLCLGADAIVVDELAQLGPLDTQLEEEKKAGKKQLTSALNPFKTLEQLQRNSLETLDLAVKMMATRSSMGLHDCLKYGIEFVRVTTGSLFTQLDPEKLGEYSRALSVGADYGHRLLRRFSGWDVEKRKRVVEKLVHGYPSHDYIIDYHELKEIGFNVSLFDAEVKPAVLGLYKHLAGEDTVVACAEPSPPQQEASEVPQSEGGKADGER
jgi:hypothetical protein